MLRMIKARPQGSELLMDIPNNLLQLAALFCLSVGALSAPNYEAIKKKKKIM